MRDQSPSDKLRAKTRNRGYQPSASGTTKEEGKSKRKASVHRKKLVSRSFDCSRFGRLSGDPNCLAEDHDKPDAQAHITSGMPVGTVYVCPGSYVTSSISDDQEVPGAGACDTCCNRTLAGQEWMNDFVLSLKQLKLKYWTGELT